MPACLTKIFPCPKICPTKIPCPTKSSPMSKNFCSNQNLISIKNFPCQKKILQCPTKICPCPTQKIHTTTIFFSIPMSIKMSILMKQDLHIPTKFPHSSKMNLFNQAYTSNFHDFSAHKIQAKTHSTIPQTTYIAKFHKSSTLSKLHHAKYLNNSKMPQRLRLQHD